MKTGTVLVTGGSRGLGRHTALCFAEAGYRLAICGRTKADLEEVVRDIQDVGGSAMYGEVDVRDAVAVRSFVDEVTAAFGPIDILVNNAGLSEYKPFVEWTLEEIDQVIDVNLKGTMYACHAVLPGMISRGSGYILNVASDIGRRAIPNMVPYVAAKHAVVGFSESLILEVRGLGVKVSVLLPGIIDTHFGGTAPGTRDSGNRAIWC
jgi:short-subunit dehydrogenase